LRFVRTAVISWDEEKVLWTTYVDGQLDDGQARHRTPSQQGISEERCDLTLGDLAFCDTFDGIHELEICCTKMGSSHAAAQGLGADASPASIDQSVVQHRGKSSAGQSDHKGQGYRVAIDPAGLVAFGFAEEDEACDGTSDEDPNAKDERQSCTVTSTSSAQFAVSIVALLLWVRRRHSRQGEVLGFRVC
jgi:hypothetical protein